MSRLMSDEEGQKWIDERAERLKLHCCTCFTDGWEVNEVYVPDNKRVLLFSSCLEESHVSCINCINAVLKVNPNHNKCLYPYNNGCTKLFNSKNLVKDNCYDKSCKECFTENLLNAFSCRECGSRFCDYCQEKCVCSDSEYSRYFSAFGKPRKISTVTDKELQEKISELMTPEINLRCPCCSTVVFKSSACNDLHHCGNIHICNFCQSSSFPWESCLPSDHWITCPRWDQDFEWFPCKENICFTEFKECTVHEKFILRLNKIRRKKTLENLKKEFGNRLVEKNE